MTINFIDPILCLREFVIAKCPSAMAAVGDRLFDHSLPVGMPQLPAVTLTIMSGSSDPQVPIFRAWTQVRVWALPGEFANARSIYGQIRGPYDPGSGAEGIHGVTNTPTTTGHVIFCYETGPSQSIKDFDTEYVSVSGFFQVGMYSETD